MEKLNAALRALERRVNQLLAKVQADRSRIEALESRLGRIGL